MILTLDIGNTRAKMSLFDAGQWLSHEAHSHVDLLPRLRQLLHDHSSLSGIHWCSVATPIEGLDALLREAPFPVKKLTSQSPPDPWQVDYRSAHTLGADRLAAAMGARSLQPEGALLVIDAGTCITYDLVAPSHRFVGGNISPGVELRLRVLHEQTAKLPLIAPEGDTPLLGYDTETALRSGVIRGIAYEIEGYLRTLGQQYPDISIFFTGGTDFRSLISTEFCTFADEFLVARGLALL